MAPDPPEWAQKLKERMARIEAENIIILILLGGLLAIHVL